MISDDTMDSAATMHYGLKNKCKDISYELKLCFVATSANDFSGRLEETLISCSLIWYTNDQELPKKNFMIA